MNHSHVPNKHRAVFLAPPQNIEGVFGHELVERARELCEVSTDGVDTTNPEAVKTAINGADIVLSTWGMPVLTDDLLNIAKRLRIVIYCASSVKYFVTDRVFEQGITVTSAARVNGRVVAEFTVALMTLCLKEAWPFVRGQADTSGFFARRQPWSGVGGFSEAKIGIVGASSVGIELLGLLSSYPCECLVYDPHVSDEEIAGMGARAAALDELLRVSDIVSLHAPNLPSLRHMIDSAKLALLKDGAWLINTARGALVDETALIAELRTGRISACLDVTDPEPPVPASPLYSLPNVVLTPHMAGAIKADCRRMGLLGIQELERFIAGLSPLYPVSPERLAIMG